MSSVNTNIGSLLAILASFIGISFSQNETKVRYIICALLVIGSFYYLGPIGIFLGISWQVGLGSLGIFLLSLSIWRIVSLSSIFAAISLPILMYLNFKENLSFLSEYDIDNKSLYLHAIEQLEK